VKEIIQCAALSKSGNIRAAVMTDDAAMAKRFEDGEFTREDWQRVKLAAGHLQEIAYFQMLLVDNIENSPIRIGL
jgi:hypothetical protein